MSPWTRSNNRSTQDQTKSLEPAAYDPIVEDHVEEEDNVEDLLPLGSDTGVVALPAASDDLTVASPGVVSQPVVEDQQSAALTDLTVAVPGGDVVVAHPDARAFELAMLEQVLPAMVRTYAVQDLTAVKTWLTESFKATDVELMIEDQFLYLSSVSLGLRVRMELLPDEPGTIERDPAIVVSKALAEIQSSAAAEAAAAAAHFQNVNEELEQNLPPELFALKKWFEEHVGVTETERFVKCLICPKISPNITHALAHIKSAHTVLSPEEEQIKSLAVAHAVDDLTRTRNPSVELLKWLNFRFLASLALDLVKEDPYPSEDDIADTSAEMVIPALASSQALEDFSALKAWMERAFQAKDVELRMQDQYLVLSSASLEFHMRATLLDSLGNLETDIVMLIPDLYLAELFKEEEVDDTFSDFCLLELFREEEEDEDDNRYFMTYEEWILYTA